MRDWPGQRRRLSRKSSLIDGAARRHRRVDRAPRRPSRLTGRPPRAEGVMNEHPLATAVASAVARRDNVQLPRRSPTLSHCGRCCPAARSKNTAAMPWSPVSADGSPAWTPSSVQVHAAVVPHQHDGSAGQLVMGGDEQVPVLGPGEDPDLALAAAVGVPRGRAATGRARRTAPGGTPASDSSRAASVHAVARFPAAVATRSARGLVGAARAVAGGVAARVRHLPYCAGGAWSAVWMLAGDSRAYDWS